MKLSTDTVLITGDMLDDDKLMQIIWLKFRAGVPVEFLRKRDMKRFLNSCKPMKPTIDYDTNHYHLIYDREKHHVRSY